MASAALAGRSAVATGDLKLAVQLCILPRASPISAPPPPEQPQPPPQQQLPEDKPKDDNEDVIIHETMPPPSVYPCFCYVVVGCRRLLLWRPNLTSRIVIAMMMDVGGRG